MTKLVLWIQTFLLPALGPAGVFLVATLDASFLSLPEINDIFVVTAAARPPHSVVGPVFWATLGSVAGSSILWWVGKRGADSAIVQKMGPERLAWAHDAFERWGALALFVPAFAPPPMPFKVFVLAAGVAHYPFGRFVVAVAAGRAVRYAFWGVIGVLYGDRALAALSAADSWTSANLGMILLGTGVAAALLVVWWLATRGDRDDDVARENPVV